MKPAMRRVRGQETAMRRWYLPLTVLGVGGVSALLMTERGRATLHKALQKFWEAPDSLLDWNDSFEAELDRIQQAVDSIAAAIQPRPELGR